MINFTIAIPTFNRNDKLKRTLESILPQLRPGIKICIFDNNSDVPVADTLAEYISDNVVVTRNRVNIGMSGNFIKCFDTCDTDWLWILGDDDPLQPDAISKIDLVFSQYSDLSFINFGSILASSRVESFMVHSQDELANKLDSFGNFLYISLCMYNVKKLAAGYRYLYQYAYTFAPHIAFVFSCLGDKNVQHNYLFCAENIINTDIRDTTVEETWNWIGLSLAIFLLSELNFGSSKLSRKRWQKHLASHVIHPKRVYSEIVKIDPNILHLNRDLYWYDQIFLRAKEAMSLRNYALFFAYRALILLKSFFLKKSSVVEDSTSIYERL